MLPRSTSGVHLYASGTPAQPQLGASTQTGKVAPG